MMVFSTGGFHLKTQISVTQLAAKQQLLIDNILK